MYQRPVKLGTYLLMSIPFTLLRREAVHRVEAGLRDQSVLEEVLVAGQQDL